MQNQVPAEQSRPPSQIHDVGEDPLMLAKLRTPAVAGHMVTRTRLLAQLAGGATAPLTLISAPAGSGKTMLLASWAATVHSNQTCWISLDEGDGRPGVFWSYLLAGVRQNGIPVSAVGVPSTFEAVDQSFLARLSACLYQLREPVVLVLDEAELLSDRAVWDSLAFLLAHTAGRFRLTVATRVDPPLPLARYRLAGMVTEIRLDDLAFTVDEARELLTAHGVGLSEAGLIRLTDRTKGWAAGLRMAAISLQHRPESDRGEEWLGDCTGDIAEYLLAEVLDAEPAGVRDFLLRTSIRSHIEPGLAEELTGRRDCARIFAGLARANVFVKPCSEHRGCFRYHPLFRDMLYAQLHYESPGRLIQLHRKAARWLAGAGQLVDAVRHGRVGADWGFAAGLVVEQLAVDRLLVGADVDRLATVFAEMPPDVAVPEAAVVAAAVALHRGDTAACTSHLAAASELADGSPRGRTPPLLLGMSVVHAGLARTPGHAAGASRSATTAKAIFAELSAPRLPAPANLRARVLAGQGASQLWNGDLDAARDTLTGGLRVAEAPGCAEARVHCLGQLALIDALHGRLRAATDLAEAANAEAERCAVSGECRPISAQAALAWARVEEYDLTAARRHLDPVPSGKGTVEDPVAGMALAVVRGRLRLARGDPDGALRFIVDGRSALARLAAPRWLDRRLQAVEMSVLVLRGRPDTAIRLAEGADPAQAPEILLALGYAWLATGDLGRASEVAGQVLSQRVALDAVVDAWLLEAACQVEKGAIERATLPLSRALRLAKPERLRRPVLDAPQRLRLFLRDHRSLAERHAWLGSAFSRLDQPPSLAGISAATPPVVEALTEKEREVLGHLQELLSTEEIAAAMFVSVNTVKTHVRGILRKLAVSRRNEAIRRARELDLI